MNAGTIAVRQLRRGIKQREDAQLYVRRRTSKRGQDRLLVSLPAPVRYALCVWGSYRHHVRQRALSQELTLLIWEALRLRLGPEAEALLEEVYEAYSKQCADAGTVNIFEAVSK